MTFKMKKIKDLCDISSGKRPELISKIKSNQTPVPIVGSGGVSGYTSKANCTKPTLVTGRVGTLGLLFCFENFWASDNTLLLHPKEQSEFLYIKYGLSGVIGTLISA